MSRPVIDSHIHLFGEPHLQNLAWMTPNNPMHKNFRLDEYLTNKSDFLELKGTIFVETDVKTDTNEPEHGYDQGAEEYLWIERIIDAKLLPAEGSNALAAEHDIIKAIIPWAPVINGAEEMARYVGMLKAKSKGNVAFHRVKGFRYLFQDKPPGTMLNPKVAEGLNWLGKNGYIFDLGIDLRSAGLWQFHEFIELISTTENVTYIVNHLTKPDLRIPPEKFDTDLKVSEWKELMRRVASDSRNTYYIKLSGGFSELPPEICDDLDKCTSYVLPWFKYLLELFGPERIIWGSDWPVCTVNGGDNAWEKWSYITREMLKQLDIDGEAFFYANTVKAYNL